MTTFTRVCQRRLLHIHEEDIPTHLYRQSFSADTLAAWRYPWDTFAMAGSTSSQQIAAIHSLSRTEEERESAPHIRTLLQFAFPSALRCYSPKNSTASLERGWRGMLVVLTQISNMNHQTPIACYYIQSHMLVIENRNISRTRRREAEVRVREPEEA